MGGDEEKWREIDRSRSVEAVSRAVLIGAILVGVAMKSRVGAVLAEAAVKSRSGIR